MIKMIRIFLLLFSSFLFSQNVQSDLDLVLKKNNLMGLTVRTFSGNIENNYNCGLRNEAQRIPVNNDTKFRVASISKAFTALGLMKLCNQKKFKLDDDISKYLGFVVINPKFPTTKITFRMLLSHTSSLQDGTGYDKFLSATFGNEKIPNISSVLIPNGQSFSNDMWRDEKPGSYFVYCNLNFGLIGTLIEKLSNQRFDAYMKNEILKPLGITGSFNLQDIDDISNVATIYRSENNNWKPQKDDLNGVKPVATDLSNYIIGNNAVYFSPQGGLRASSSDLLKFIKYIKSNGKSVPNLISKTTLKKMKKSQWKNVRTNGDTLDGFFMQYALGLHQTNKSITDIVNNPELFGNFIGHAGNAYGLISDAYFSEKQNFGFVIITNGSFNAFEKGKNSSFYNFEEQIFKIICEDYSKNKNNFKK